MADTTDSIAADAAAIPGIAALNYANGMAFGLNIIVTFGSQKAVKWGMKDNATLSAKYQTLVTPAGYAFAIWALIFLSQTIWTVLQFMPEYRSSIFVADIVGYNFVYACIFQCMWSICFGYEQITISLVAMVAILMSLMPIVHKLFTLDNNSNNFWTMEFPMEIYAGWIMAATLVNLNVVFVSHGISTKLQTLFAWTSLTIVLFVGIAIQTPLQMIAAVDGDHHGRYVIPCVLAWASFAISKELEHPKESIATNFSPDVISSTKTASRMIAILILVVAAGRFGFGLLFN